MYWNLIKKINSKDTGQVFPWWGDGGGILLLAENLLILFPSREIPHTEGSFSLH